MSRDIFIGDLQGCCTPFERLLDRLGFDPAADRLFMAGDLVNRGGESLAALRRVHALRSSVTSVLGNHDLHLLAYAFGHRRKPNQEFDEILEAPDCAELLDWLRRCPLAWIDHARALALVHAGVDPRWSPDQLRPLAAEVEQALRDDPDSFFAHMYGDEPDYFSPGQTGGERLRTLTNVFTRLRFCTPAGRLDFAAKGGPGDAPAGVGPWFDYLHPDWNGWTLVFGHWSQLGYFDNGQAVCLDSGCVWGNALTALVIAGDERWTESIDCGC